MLTKSNLKIKQSTPPPLRENYLNKNKINKKSISPIIATLLIITVSVVLGVSMYDWYSEYTKTISSDIGDKGFSKEIRIDYINQNTIYAFNEYSKAQIKSISVDGNECDLVDSNNNFSKGTIQISFDESCTQNLNSNINEVVVVSDKGTYSTLLSISNSNYVFSNDGDQNSNNDNTEETIINYCPSGSFTYENVLFDYLDIEDGLTKNIVEVNSISGGSKTSYINITCNYPDVDYDPNTFTSSVVCDPNYSLTSSNTCELITSCNSGDYLYNGELFPYPFLDSGSEYVSVIEEIDSNLILSKNLGLLCENTIVSNTSYEEVLGCLDGYELEEVKEFLETKITDKVQNLFGYSVSIYEDTLVVGAYGDDGKGYNSGSAYIFEKNSNGDWNQIQKIRASDGTKGDQFGYSVSIYENTIVVGAYGDSSAYIFEKDSNGGWKQIQKIRASGGLQSFYFGISVSIYENTIVIGDHGGNHKRGFAYIFEKDSNGDWNQIQILAASDRRSGDIFGHSVSIYENTIIVGAYGDDDKGYSSGSAYIFEKDSNGEFEQIQKITASDGTKGDHFGHSVSIYKDTLVIGALYDDDKSSDSGSTYIFEKNSNGDWSQKQKITASDGAGMDWFGISVSIYEDTLVVGAKGDDLHIGSAYIFEKNSNRNWEEIKKLMPSHRTSQSSFGYSVSIYEDTLVVGAYADESAYIFEIGEKETYCKLE